MYHKGKLQRLLLALVTALAAFFACFLLFAILRVFACTIDPNVTTTEWCRLTVEYFFCCLPIWGTIVALSGWIVFRHNEHRYRRGSSLVEVLAMMVQSEKEAINGPEPPEVVSHNLDPKI